MRNKKTAPELAQLDEQREPLAEILPLPVPEVEQAPEAIEEVKRLARFTPKPGEMYGINHLGQRVPARKP
jgi:hypothetical protein